MSPLDFKPDWDTDAALMDSIKERDAIIERFHAALQECGAGNFDDETYEQFHDRVRQVCRDALHNTEDQT